MAALEAQVEELLPRACRARSSSSLSVLPRISSMFMAFVLSVVGETTDHLDLDGHLVRHALEGHLGHVLGHAADLEEHGAGLDHRGPELRLRPCPCPCASRPACAETGLCGKTRIQTLRLAAGRAAGGDAAGLDLPAGEPAGVQRLQAEVAERDACCRAWRGRARGRGAPCGTSSAWASSPWRVSFELAVLAGDRGRGARRARVASPWPRLEIDRLAALEVALVDPDLDADHAVGGLRAAPCRSRCAPAASRAARGPRAPSPGAPSRRRRGAR